MSAADNLGNLFVALLAGIPLLIFVLFACCACLEASIQAARRSYKPHLPTRVRFADEAGEETPRQQSNPLLFGLKRSNRGGGERLEGSGLVAHSSYIQKFPNYRYSTVGQSSGRSTPPPVLKSRTELGSGSLKSPVSPQVETQRLLDHDFCHRAVSTPSRSSLVGSPIFSTCSVPPPAAIAHPSSPLAAAQSPVVVTLPGKGVQSPVTVGAAIPPQPPSVPIVGTPVTGKPSTPKQRSSPSAPSVIAVAATILSQKALSSPSPTSALPPGRAVRQDTSNSADTQQIQASLKPSPTHITSVLNFFDGNQRSSTSTPTTTPAFRPKSPFENCGPHVDPQQQRRYSTPSSPTMYAYAQEVQSNHSSMSYLPEVRTYLHFMEEDFSNRQRSHSFSGRCASRSPRKIHPYLVPRSPSPFTLERTMVEDSASKSMISTPSSFGTTFLTPPGSTDQGSFKSPESMTPEWLLSSDVPPTRFIIPTAIETDEGGVTYKEQQLSRSNSIRAATV